MMTVRVITYGGGGTNRVDEKRKVVEYADQPKQVAKAGRQAIGQATGEHHGLPHATGWCHGRDQTGPHQPELNERLNDHPLDQPPPQPLQPPPPQQGDHAGTHPYVPHQVCCGSVHHGSGAKYPLPYAKPRPRLPLLMPRKSDQFDREPLECGCADCAPTYGAL
jgi:hypothetical protein